MKLRPVAFAVLAAALVPSFAAAAAPAHKDAWCPAAGGALDTLDSVTASNDPTKIGSAAHSIVDTYLGCAAEAQVAKNVEPAMNYDKTRAAQFQVVVARTLAAQGKTSDAIAAYREARKLAMDVAEWTPSSMSYTASNGLGGTSMSRNTSRGTSQYHDPAIQIRDAVDAELAKLGAGQGSAPANAAPAASPSAAASPAP